MRYERRFYSTKSGLAKALKRWTGDIVHYFQTGNGWMLCRRVD